MFAILFNLDQKQKCEANIGQITCTIQQQQRGHMFHFSKLHLFSIPTISELLKCYHEVIFIKRYFCSRRVLTEDSSKCRMEASGLPQRGRGGMNPEAAGTDTEV